MSDGGVPVASASSVPSEVPNPEPTVVLPAGVEALFPAPGATDLCPDPTLHVRFSGKPRLGTRGKVQVFDVANPGTPVASVDLSQSTITDTRGGSTFTLPIGAYVDGNEAIFTLPARGLGYGKTFYVTVESGALTTPQGTAWGITDTETWRFTTVDAQPAAADTLRVALDGSGQYCTVQAAIDAAEDDTTILIGEGNYYGVVYFKDKHGLTLRGDDRAGTALKGVNNNNLNPSTRGRALIGSEDLTDLVIENLTIHNLTPQDGSQAEALTLLSCDRCIVRDADILSLQDTLLWSGRVYADNCYISGNVDYIWGTGAVYFNACEIHTTGRKGYNVQARNAQNGHGYVFVDSKLTSDAGVTGDILARIDVSEYPASEVAYINCEMGSHIAPQGWLISGGSAPASLRFLEYQSRDPSGNLLNVSQRMSGSRQLSASEAAVYRDPAQVLGGWTPEGP
jgi:pectin methylesterase-like acyl-CoA thioesterase